MKSISTLTIGLGIMVLLLLDASLGEANPDRIGTLQFTDEILRSKMAFGVVEEEIARGLNLGTLVEQDYQKLRGPVLLEIQTAIHSQLREQFGKIVDAVDFGASSDSDASSQSPSTHRGDKPGLHKKAAEIIRDFITQKYISVIVIADAPIGGSEVSVIHGLGGEVRSSYDIINGACVAIPVKNLSALIRHPSIREIWPNGKAKFALDDSVQQIGADRVHNQRPAGLGVTGRGVIVGVVDDGIDSSHPEFANRLVDARGKLGGFRDTADLDNDPDQDDDHGTHVAGIIGAAADGREITGVAPEVKFLDAKVHTWYNHISRLVYSDYSNLMGGILWAAQKRPANIPFWKFIVSDPLSQLVNLAAITAANPVANRKADVINMSMGWIYPWKYPRDGSDPLCRVIDQVVSDGTVVVLAAGNSGKERDSGSVTFSPNATPIAWHDCSKTGDTIDVTLIWSNSVNDLDLVILDENGGVLCESRNTNGNTTHGTLYEQVKCPSENNKFTVQVEGHSDQGEQKYEVWVNEGKFSRPDPTYTLGGPGYSKKAITVGNVFWSSTLNPSSSQGPSDIDLIKPEVVAPGTDINSTVLNKPQNNYADKTGTSMAAPHVAGVAALILDAVGKNSNGKWNFSPDEVKSAIVRGAERGVRCIPTTPDSAYGAGLVKADNIIFGGTVPSRGTLRFEIEPRLLGSWFRGYFLNAENAYPSANPVSLVAAISWENTSRNLDLALSYANGNTARAVKETGSDYEKIIGQFRPSQGAVYYLDVINRSNHSVTFTGASMHPIKSLSHSNQLSSLAVKELDVTGDGDVDVEDLMMVALIFTENFPFHRGDKEAYTAAADVSCDGVIDLDDMELIAVELEKAIGAPAAPNLSRVTLETVQQWLSEAKRMRHPDPNFLRGLAILEQLLALVTPAETALLPNYPNPFNPETWIPYQLANVSTVRITIYDVHGTIVRHLDLGHQEQGYYTDRSRAAYWDGRNTLGEPVASGVYFYTIRAGDFTATRKLLIRK